MIQEVSEALSKTILNILNTVLPALFTLDTIVLMTVIVIITESIKQAIKGNFGTKYFKMNHMEDYQIRVLTILLGVGLASFYLNTHPIKDRIMLGIFYGGLSVVLYAILKRYFLRKISPNIENKLSGQNPKNTTPSNKENDNA